MTKKTEKKSTPAASTPATASKSKLRKGTGSRRETNRIITIYGPFKTRKTGMCRNLPRGRTKWLISDPNCIPTLRALDKVPHADDVYEMTSLTDLVDFLEEALKMAEDAVVEGRDPNEELGIDFLVLDSFTQFSDWHQQHIAASTGQRFLGDNEKENGWQLFNAQMGRALDCWAALSRYITCIGIVHAKSKVMKNKGEYAAFSLSPAMSERLGRLSNWILLKDFVEVIDDAEREKAISEKDDPPVDSPYVVEADGDEGFKVYKDLVYTRPVGAYVASANSPKLLPTETGYDLCYLLRKDGLLPEE